MQVQPCGALYTPPSTQNYHRQAQTVSCLRDQHKGGPSAQLAYLPTSAASQKLRHNKHIEHHQHHPQRCSYKNTINLTNMDKPRPTNDLGPRHDATSRVQKPESAADRMADLKARVAAAIGTSKEKGGLNVGLHPALEDLGQWKPPAKSAEQKPSVGSAGELQSEQTKLPANVQPSPFRDGQAGGSAANPYIEADAPGVPTGKQRTPRQLAFNQKGKYMQQGIARRKQARLDEMKKRIAEQTRKAGINEDLDEKCYLVEEPPDVEWWDEALVTSYDAGDNPNALKTVVSNLIQHPVPLEPPQERNAPAPKPMYLTSKEKAKIRRQNRMANLKEQQAKTRLGLIPTPPPKLKMSNLIRVLANKAVTDPTAGEAMVHQQSAERHQKHLQANEERKLTKEQKLEKLLAKQEKNAAKGLHLAVFKIGSLANGRHRFKIQKNAEQLAITGICVMHPKFNLLIAEGGQWGIRTYKKLLMNRINWTENVPSRGPKEDHQRQWLVAEDENGSLKDMTSNYCTQVFEGEVKTRAFKRWTSKVVETDDEAHDALVRSKMENFWSMARSMT